MAQADPSPPLGTRLPGWLRALRRLSLLLWLWLLLLGVQRVLLAWRDGALLEGYGLRLSPALLIAGGIVWSLFCLAALLCLWIRAWRRAGVLLLAAGILLALHWAERLWLAGGLAGNWPWALLASLLFAASQIGLHYGLIKWEDSHAGNQRP